MRRAQKLFVGPKVRVLREARGWTLDACASQLGLSASYLSQIESNQRPVTSRVLMALVDAFHIGVSELDAADDDRLIADLREALADFGGRTGSVPASELRAAALHAPALARRYLELHRAYRRLDERLRLTEEAVALDEAAAASSLLPYEEVRDFFHYKDNYLHSLDTAAEALALAIGGPGAMQDEADLAGVLGERLGVSVRQAQLGEVMRRYDRATRTLWLNETSPEETRRFQMAFHLVSRSLSDLIEDELGKAGLKSREAIDICRIGLGNYAAGAFLMPYRAFAASARALRHDVDELSRAYRVSLEQACHRLSNLQRPGERGVPIYFVRMDHAGNITKRHSATRFRFARFGGTCPLWNVHDAMAAPDRYLVQVAQMPDGTKYLCVARSIAKRAGGYLSPVRRYVLGFGCELQHAGEMIYSSGLDLKASAARIGVSCRICERDDCAQRAFPPVDRRLVVPENERAIVPFSLGAG
ncbi:helix-turn-helix domain-containing protein [Phenylobacterium koreense]|uniref:Transcriptional regulator/transcriptional regulator with XRE-family HTH domain n=1 Tax=Phenylobacterium koreense TaxID=266125 RepID=A0ABV2EK85_9CAUL